MKILRNFVVTGGLLRSNGDQAQVGDTVRLYPYEGDSFLATIEAVAPVNCGQDRAYAIEYDLDVVLRVCDLQDRGDVLDCCALLEERVEVLENAKPPVSQIVQATRSSPLTVNTSVVTDLFLDTLIEGPNNSIDDDSYVIVPTSNWYDVNIRVGFDSFPSAAPRCGVDLNLSGVGSVLSHDTSVRESTGPGVADGYPAFSVSGKIFFAAGDQLSLKLYQNSFNNVAILLPLANYNRSVSLTITEATPLKKPFTRKIVGAGNSNMAGIFTGGRGVAITFLSDDIENLGVTGTTITDTLTIASTINAAGGPNVDLVLNAPGVNDIGFVLNPDIPAMVDKLEQLVASTPNFRRRVWMAPTPSTYAYTNAANFEADRQLLIQEVVSRNIPGLLIARVDLDRIGLPGADLVRDFYYDKLHATTLAQYRMSKVVEPLLA